MLPAPVDTSFDATSSISSVFLERRYGGDRAILDDIFAVHADQTGVGGHLAVLRIDRIPGGLQDVHDQRGPRCPVSSIVGKTDIAPRCETDLTCLRVDGPVICDIGTQQENRTQGIGGNGPLVYDGSAEIIGIAGSW